MSSSTIRASRAGERSSARGHDDGGASWRQCQRVADWLVLALTSHESSGDPPRTTGNAVVGEYEQRNCQRAISGDGSRDFCVKPMLLAVHRAVKHLGRLEQLEPA